MLLRARMLFFRAYSNLLALTFLFFGVFASFTEYAPISGRAFFVPGGFSSVSASVLAPYASVLLLSHCSPFTDHVPVASRL